MCGMCERSKRGRERGMSVENESEREFKAKVTEEEPQKLWRRAAAAAGWSQR